MKDLEIKSHSIVIIDNTFNNFNNFDFSKNIPLQIKNPFEQIASPLALKGSLGMNVVELPNSDKVHKEFMCGGEIKIEYDFFPPKLQIKYSTNESNNKVQEIAQKLIDFADIGKSIGAIGVNYELFIENDKINVKDHLLKKEFKDEFSSLSATLVLKINDNTTLSLRVADAKIENKQGIYFMANFHNNINKDNNIDNIFKKDFLKISKDKIEAVFNKKFDIMQA